jgi:uncharacterized membrane protein
MSLCNQRMYSVPSYTGSLALVLVISHQSSVNRFFPDDRWPTPPPFKARRQGSTAAETQTNKAMNPNHLHLLLNHLPVLGTLFGLLLFVVAYIRRSEELTRASLVVFVLAGAAAVAAYLTGEGAEEVVENIGISDALIELHESAAFYALVAAIVLGVFALGSLLFYYYRTRLPRSLSLTVLVLAIAASGLMAWTADLGGQIRRPELQSASVTQQVDQRTTPAGTKSHEEDDDD